MADGEASLGFCVSGVCVNFTPGGDDASAEILEGLMAVGGLLNTQIDETYKSTKTLIGQVEDNLVKQGENVHAAVVRDLDNQDSWIGRQLTNIIGSLANGLGNSNAATVDDLLGTENRLTEFLTQAGIVLSGDLNGIIEHVSEEHENTVEQIMLGYGGGNQQVLSKLADANNVLDIISETLGNFGHQTITNIIDFPEAIFNAGIERVADIFNDELDKVVEDFAEKHGAVGEIFGEALSTIGDSFPDTQDELKDINKSLGGLGDKVSEAIDRQTEAVVDEERDKILDNVLKFGFASEQAYEDLLKAGRVGDGIKNDNDSEWYRCVEQNWEHASMGLGQYGAFTGLIRGLASLMNEPNALKELDQARTLRKMRRCYSDQIPDDNTLAYGMWEGDYRDSEVEQFLVETGIRPADAKIKMGTFANRLTPYEYIAAWLRGELNETQLGLRLKRIGIQKDDRETMKKLAYFIPPVADLVRMAVREAFSPEIVRKNDALADLPRDFIREAGKQGVSKDWAEKYWAAHWGLPSPQMGFEMLHRGIINETDLDDLLRQLDVMPAWRKRLTDISYRPLTRVDIRRMHAMGVIDEERVTRAYKDIGYNDENAALMTQFTVAYNTPAEDVDEDEAKSLTRASIMGFYEDGIISETDAKDALSALGYDDEAVGYYIESSNLDMERAERKKAIAAALANVRSGAETAKDALRDLRKQNLSDLEKTRVEADMARIEKARNKLPSKADLMKFFDRGLLGEGELLTNLKNLGYNNNWADLYVRLAKGETG